MIEEKELYRDEEEEVVQNYRILLQITPREYECLIHALDELGYEYEEL